MAPVVSEIRVEKENGALELSALQRRLGLR